MKYDEYINQPNPRKLPSGSVEIQKSDPRVQLYPTGVKGITGVYLQYKDENLSYLLPSDGDTLWTQDSNGNLGKRSVFKLV